MTNPIPLNLAVEDALTEAVIGKMLTVLNRFAMKIIYSRGGFGYIRKNINGFNHAARGIPFLVLTDLDEHPCPAALIDDWLLGPKHHNLLLRVAVREVEAWVLADKVPFAHFLGVRSELLPDDVSQLRDPKRFLIDLARSSPKRELRSDICPREQSTSKIGPNYNGRLASFVSRNWNPVAASHNSASLRRALAVLRSFQPVWAQP